MENPAATAADTKMVMVPHRWLVLTVVTRPCAVNGAWLCRPLQILYCSENWYMTRKSYKKLSYRRWTARCVVSIEILPIATQQCRNYLYDKSWPNRWYEVGDLVGGNAWQTTCTQPWRDRVGCHCLKCHKQTDDGRIVYITCLPTTCCGEIF